LNKSASISYTQWEAWLALYHHRALFVAKADDKAEREKTFVKSNDERAAQDAHLARLAKMERFPGCTFTSPDNLAKHILASLHDILPPRAPEKTPHTPNNLPYASLGSLFKGRDEVLGDLHKALTASTGAALARLGWRSNMR
jgi:hypothetical protein